MKGTMANAKPQDQEQKAPEYYIPPRPSVNLKMLPSGEIEIDVWQMADSMERLESVTMTLPPGTALEVAEAIIQMLKNRPERSTPR